MLPRDPFLRKLFLGFILIAAALALVPGLARPQTYVTGFCGYSRVQTPADAIITSGAAIQRISVGTTAVRPTLPGLTEGVVVGAIFQVLIGIINERHDDTAPIASSAGPSMTYGPGGTTVSTTPVTFESCGSDLRKIRLIRASASATDAQVNVIYYVPGS